MSKEPKSPLTRYAFGYSDQKPGKIYWLVQLAVCGLAIYFILS